MTTNVWWEKDCSPLQTFSFILFLFKITIPHNEKFFVNSLPLFVKTSRKFFPTKIEMKPKSISLFSPHWRHCEGIKVKKESMVSVTMKEQERMKTTFVFWALLLFACDKVFCSFMVLWFWLKAFRALNYSQNFLKAPSCIRNYESLTKRRSVKMPNETLFRSWWGKTRIRINRHSFSSHSFFCCHCLKINNGSENIQKDGGCLGMMTNFSTTPFWNLCKNV